MRVIGLDIGEKRVGVAVSDPGRRVATPVTVLDAAQLARDVRPLTRIIDDYEARLIVVGLPLTLEGAEGPQAARVRSFADRLSGILAVPIRFADERLSSVEAGRRMREAGADERRQRGAKDMVAASIFLQSYLDSLNSARPGEGDET